MADQVFAEGLGFFEPHSNAPEFIKGCISVNREKFTEWMRSQEVNEKGYIKLDVKEARSGNLYVSVNNYKPERDQQRGAAPAAPAPVDDGGIDGDIPF